MLCAHSVSGREIEGTHTFTAGEEEQRGDGKVVPSPDNKASLDPASLQLAQWFGGPRTVDSFSLLPSRGQVPRLGQQAGLREGKAHTSLINLPGT